MTRVIAGLCRGLTLSNPKNNLIRPTTDRVKEWIFSVLYDVKGLRVLDLFCGAGNLGIEALSRGASYCTFVDQSYQAITITEENIAKAQFEEKAEVVRQNVFAFLRNPDSQFELVFADPPYDFKKNNELIPEIAEILTSEGIFVLEFGKYANNKLINNMQIVRSKSFGNTVITMFGKDNA